MDVAMIMATLFMLFGFLFPKTFKLLGFQIFWFREYLMNVIPETCRAH
jgi:hypothetical protein